MKNIFQAGQAMMIATILFLVVSVTIIFGLAGPIVRQQKIVSNLITSRQSYFVAEAGVEDVSYRFITDKAVGASETINLSGSSATTVTTDTSEGKLITGTGNALNNIRKVRTELIFGEGVSFNYGIQVGTGGFELSNNAGVVGNVYSNANITGQNGSYITGDAFAVGSVSGVSVSGTTLTGQTSQAFSITDAQISGWKDEALVGGVVGSQDLDGTNNTLGPKKIEGDLELDNNAVLTVTGTLWVTGNLVLSNGAEVKLDSSYGSGDGVIVVDGVSTLSNDAEFNGSGTSGSYIMLLSTNNTGSAIVLSNNAGAVILYAPEGTVKLSNNAGIKQVTAKTIELQNNSTIIYESGLVNSAFTSGPSGGYSITSWQEVE